MNKMNCWELKKCGREPGGAKTAEYGVCPAAESTDSNGVNSGKNGGHFLRGKSPGGFCAKTGLLYGMRGIQAG
jgi:hypothetical protein